MEKQAEKSKSGKIKIIITSIVSVLLILIFGTLIWYHNSPFPTMVKMGNAVKNKNMDTMIDCIEPDKANMIRGLMSYLDMDTSSLMDRMTSNESSLSDRPEMKFAGYHRDGDKAYIEITEKGGNDTAENRIINFVRIDGKWYLTFDWSSLMP